jgi:hypothetical protein
MFLRAVCAVKAILASAKFRTFLANVVALTVFFLALGSFTVASFHSCASYGIVKSISVTMFDLLLSLLNGMSVFFTI